MPQSESRKANRAALGVAAEQLVCDRLVGLGYAIVDRNVRVGRLEIDVIARQGNLMVFCEVRGRSSDAWMTPAQSIDAAKVKRIRQAAAVWLKNNRPSTSQVRFDVASVVFDRDPPRIDYFERAF